MLQYHGGEVVGYGEAAGGRERSFNRDDSTAELTSTFLHLGYCLCFLTNAEHHLDYGVYVSSKQGIVQEKAH